MPTTTTSDALEEALRSLRAARLLLEEAQGALHGAATGITDEQRERLRTWLRGETDGELVAALLAIHKLAEDKKVPARELLIQGEATAITAVLERFAPEALDAGLELYYAEEADADARPVLTLLQGDSDAQG